MPDWFSILFSGTAAAVLGLGGAVLVFRLSRKAEQRDTAERERRQHVARISATVHGELVPALVTYRWRRTQRAVLATAEVVEGFVVDELAEHPAVARWSLEELERLVAAFDRFETLRWLPGHQRRRLAAVESCGLLASQLPLWERGIVDDAWFEARLNPSNDRPAEKTGR